MKYIRLLLLVLCVSFCSCGDEEEKSNIPDYTVNLLLHPTGIDDYLSTIGNIGIYLPASDKVVYEKLIGGLKGVKVYTAPRLSGEAIGYSGLLVIRTGVDTDMISGLAAFDLCCPNEVMQSMRVVPTSKGTAKCSLCGSEFNLWENGRAIEGSAKASNYKLKSYHVRSENGKFRVIR